MCCCGSSCAARARLGACLWVLGRELSWCLELHMWQETLLCFKSGPYQLRASGAPVALHKRLFEVSNLFFVRNGLLESPS